MNGHCYFIMSIAPQWNVMFALLRMHMEILQKSLNLGGGSFITSQLQIFSDWIIRVGIPVTCLIVYFGVLLPFVLWCVLLHSYLISHGSSQGKVFYGGFKGSLFDKFYIYCIIERNVFLV